jgi:hypothetical protein
MNKITAVNLFVRTLLLIIIPLLGAVSPVFSQEDELPLPLPLPLPEESSEVVGKAAFYPNPYNCEAKVDNPHHSTHQPGTINVVAKTNQCSSIPAKPAEVYVEVTL